MSASAAPFSDATASINSERSTRALHTYEASCKRRSVHCNSLLKHTLLLGGGGGGGADALAGRSANDATSSIPSLAAVKHLDFSNNLFGCHGILPVLETVLACCPNLESLNLAQNYLSNASIECLYHLLEPNGSRHDTNAGSRVDYAAASSGSSSADDAVVRLCPRLQYLDLTGNPISASAGKLLSRLVDSRPHLRRVLLGGTLVNRGLQGVIQAKCAKKSPRFDGLRALSMVVGDVRPAAVETATMQQPLAPSTLSADMAEDVPRRSSSPSTVSQPMPLANGTGMKRPGMAPANLLCMADAALGPLSNAGGEHSPAGAAAEWTAMETIWNLATVAAPPQDGWTGLAAVMALVRQDATIASMY